MLVNRRCSCSLRPGERREKPKNRRVLTISTESRKSGLAAMSETMPAIVQMRAEGEQRMNYKEIHHEGSIETLHSCLRGWCLNRLMNCSSDA
jgi:hypothetical protein